MYPYIYIHSHAVDGKILHHLVDGLSGYDPIMSRCFIGIPIVAPTGAGIRKHPQYIYIYIYIHIMDTHRCSDALRM